MYVWFSCKAIKLSTKTKLQFFLIKSGLVHFFRPKIQGLFQDFPGPYLEISRTFFNDNFTSKPRKMFLLTSMFSWPFHCLEDFLRISSCFLSFIWLSKPDFPITFRSMLLLPAKQNGLFEFLSSFRSQDL